MLISDAMRLDGQVACITGATGGLGRTFANTIAELGGNLLLTDKPGTDLSACAEEISRIWGIKAESFPCDLEHDDERQLLIGWIKERPSLDILINNAAFVGTSDLTGWNVPFEEQTLQAWRRGLEVNLTAVFDLSQSLAPTLRASTKGRILNVGSIYGTHGPDWRIYNDTSMGNPAAYAASKGGLIQLTRWLATTLAPEVRVNCISPGGILREQSDIFQKSYIDRTPAMRMGSEADLVGPIVFLTTGLSSYVTGQNILIDGGWSVW